MKKHVLLLFICLLFFGQKTVAQNWVQAQIIVPQPVPITTPELLGRTGETVLILTNTHPSNKLDVMLGATLKGNNGVSGSLDPRNLAPSQTITLLPGEPAMFTGDDLLNVFSNYTIYDVEYEGIDLEELVLNPLFPEGAYTVCVMVYDYHTKELVSASPPINCSPPITVRTPDPPIIIAPQNEDILPFGPFETIAFRWTNVTLPGRFFDYDFYLAEVPPGVNPYDAIESKNFLLYAEENFPANVLIYDQTKPPLPEGTYAVRVRAKDPTGQVKVKNGGWSDVVVFQPAQPLLSPPQLVDPKHEEEWNQQNQYNFKWTNVVAPNASINYRLQVAVDKNLGPQSEVFDNPDLVLLDEMGMDALNFQYEIPPQIGLDPGFTYLARVQAYDKLGMVKFENDGWSEVHTFTIAAPAAQPNQEFDCGEGCFTALPNGPAVNFFQKNDEVRMGNFVLKLGGVTRSGNTYNGPAEIVAGSFFPFPLRVNLQNAQFNRDGLAIGGTAESLAPESPYLPANWMTPTGNFSLPTNLRNTSDFLETAAVNVNQRFTQSQALPVRFGDVFLLSLRLEPTTAKANFVSLKSLGADRFGSRKYLAFGKKQVCMSPGGPAANGAAAMLPLLANVTVSESARLSVTIQKTVSGAPHGGTVKPLDCTGETDIAAVGYVEIRDNEISVKNGNNWIAGQRVYGRFAAEFYSWSVWMADLTFVPQNSLNSFGGSAQTLRFKLDDLKGYEFEATEAILDHSAAENAAGFTPANVANYQIAGRNVANLWGGVVFQDVEVKLPSYILKNNNDRIGFNFPNLGFDAYGLSGSIGIAFDEYGLLSAKIGTWPTALSSFSLELEENNVEEARFSGGFDIPFFGDRFYFQANCPPGEEVPEMELTVPESARLSIWNADVSLNSNSDIYVLPALVDGKLYFGTRFHGSLDFDDRIDNVRGISLNNIGFSYLTVWNQSTSPFGSSGRLYPMTVASFQIPSSTKKIAGYFANIRSMRVWNLANRDVELKLDYEFSFDDMLYGLNARTDFKVTARKQNGEWQRRASNIVEIPIDEELPGLDLNGAVSYETHSNGYHFEGDLTVDVFDDFTTIQAHAELGRLNSRSYWGFTGQAEIGAPVPIFPGVNMRGFGGGAYYRMNKTNTSSGSLTNIDFTPQTSGGTNFGILANVILESPDPTTFNGRFLLEVDFDDWSLSDIRMSGNAHFLDEVRPANFWENTSQPDNDAQIKIDGNMRLKWSGAKFFHANFGYGVNMKPNGILRGSRSDALRLFFSANSWYIRLGSQHSPVRLTFRPSMKIDGESYSLGNINTDAYFEAGSFGNLRFGLGADYDKTWNFDQEVGFANRFAARTSFDFDFNGGFGRNLTYCSNHPSKDWFAYLDASIQVEGEVGYEDRCDDWNPADWFFECGDDFWRWADASFGLSGKMYMPNPTGFAGTLEVGAFGFDADLPFRLGGRCE